MQKLLFSVRNTSPAGSTTHIIPILCILHWLL